MPSILITTTMLPKGEINLASILIVDDEKAIRELIKNGLRKDGHIVTAYASAAAVPMDSLNHFDLILLDIMMPDMDGLEFCKKIRGLVDCPILFLSAKAMENDITLGLGLGADDYLLKPFRIAELRARVNAHLRREHRERHSALVFDRIRIDLSEKSLQVDNTTIPLTKSEYLICQYLAKTRDRFSLRSKSMKPSSVGTVKAIARPSLPISKTSGPNWILTKFSPFQQFGGLVTNGCKANNSPNVFLEIFGHTSPRSYLIRCYPLRTSFYWDRNRPYFLR